MPAEAPRSQADLLAHVEGLVERGETSAAFTACKATAQSLGFRDEEIAASLGLSDLSKCALDELSGLRDDNEITRLSHRALKLAEKIASRPSDEAEERRRFDPESPAGRLAMAREKLKQLTVAGSTQTEIEHARNAVLEARREVRKGNRLHEGDILADRYEVVQRVGVGGFATVWKCYDEELQKLVAVKVLHPSHHDDGPKRERFFRGARIMKDSRTKTS